MAQLDSLYWPLSLPRKALLDGYAPVVTSAAIRETTDRNPLHRGWGDLMLDAYACKYVMTGTQVRVFRDFCRLSGARSFWMPHPDPADPAYTADKWWYARIRPSGENTVSEASAVGGGRFTVPVSLEFWRMVPGVTPPAGA